jgi:hypothetical protein
MPRCSATPSSPGEKLATRLAFEQESPAGLAAELGQQGAERTDGLVEALE